jgi:hypothetical protein
VTIEHCFVQSSLALTIECIWVYPVLQKQENHFCVAIAGCCAQGLFPFFGCPLFAKYVLYSVDITLARGL